ncbi:MULTISPECIES: helix-turn-helix domain-containing protein [Blautia]|uniref:PucR family transcriptional regulator n=1 Tax=Blautia TaxID=572511 RepID=UPI000BA2C10D
MYLKCACSRSATANRLYVHRNTVAYQLNKIQEILDIDLDDGEACLQLYLSYKICELRTPCNNG